MKAYLAGAIEHAPDNGVRWRRHLTNFLSDHLDHSVYDPTSEEISILTPEESENFRQYKEDNLLEFQRIVRKLIAHDLSTLTGQIDYVICFWDEHVKNGGGTQGELTVAYHYNIPVYLVAGMPVTEISGWILGCVTELFPSFDHLENYLIETFNGNR
ncbi:MAG: hypothetical protein K9N46_03760 [Candidatus Marinimicrobia bacterium]|nr:hypothetical protein [Candidatus Neomarinimicrobiota bacterium]MCF7829678.1 hypothetical protein [Candidatus Neomarinimicrobiota bacterium]MCF7879838.1 hypothetical protein [Candidatus Neomarinimicrobiota bacterium]